MTGDLNALARHLARIPKVLPVYVEEIKAAGLHSLDAESLVEQVDTRTLQASETPFAGEPEGRGLPYQEGHVPLGAGAREAVLRAAGTWGIVGVVNDALSRAGVPYGLFLPRFLKDHAKAAAALPGVMAAAAPDAWRKAWRAA